MENAIAQINYLAVLAAAISAFVLGGVWYAVFKNVWMSASGITEEQTQQGHPAKVFGIAFIWSLLGAFVFAMFLGPAPAFGYAAAAGFAAGLFWVAGSFAINYQFEQKPFKLLLVNGGYHTVQYTLYGAILGLWH
ncbi:MAG TPA: DUF1761 domain-containing protein [Gammaproteobacteria bacterium]